MPLFINTNVASLNAQRNLNTSQLSLSTALQRLSSGLRINSARDDAAGLAISQRFTSQIRGSVQAARNANDGISLAQTAEGALAEVGNNLQRLRELAVQSANATNSTTDRAALQSEASQLIAEIDRVATTTKFNGVALLDGSFTAQQFQVGADAGQTISITSITSARTFTLGTGYSASLTGAVATSAVLASGDVTLNGVSVGASVAGTAAGQTTDSAFAKAAAINAAAVPGVTAVANAVTGGGTVTSVTATGSSDVTINGIAISSLAAAADATARATAVVSAVNAVSAATGVTATSSGAGVTLSAADGRNIAITLAGVNTLEETGFGALAVNAATTTTRGTITLTGTTSTGIVVAGAAPAVAGLTAGTTAATLGGTAISVTTIASVSGANTAIASIDAALATVNSTRADLGAYQNRFSSTVANLNTIAENLSASRGRILDADFAAETASLTRSQILQQAGTAILAQANSLPQQVLALLR